VPTIDDEYANATLADPKICVTTSRDPTQRLIQFAKEVALMIPNATKMNRGRHHISEILEAARANEYTDIVIVHETRGEPGTAQFLM
jgi:U3 small nucleolar ribonucleoprotein protein IMP4